MAEAYLLKVRVVLDESYLNKMQKNVEKKLEAPAKKFGKTIANSIKGGISTFKWTSALIKKIVPNSGDLNNAIDETLNKSFNISDMAAKYGVSNYNAGKAMYVAERAGISESDFQDMLKDFDKKLNEQKSGKKDHGLADFTNYVDSLNGMYAYMESLAKMSNRDSEKAKRIMQKTFGESNSEKAFKIANSNITSGENAFDKKLRENGLNENRYNKAISGGAVSLEKQNQLKANRNLDIQLERQDIINKDSNGILSSQDKLAKTIADNNTNMLKNAEASFNLFNSMEGLKGEIEKMQSNFIPLACKLLEVLYKLTSKISNVLNRGLGRFLFGGDDEEEKKNKKKEKNAVQYNYDLSMDNIHRDQIITNARYNRV